MTTLLAIGLINALIATVLAIVVWCVTRVWRQPVVAQLLWVLVLVKLVTPPLIAIPWTFERSTQTIPVPFVTKMTITQHDLSVPNELVMPTLNPKRAQAGNGPINVPVARQLDITPYTSPDWETIALAVWLVGSAVWLLTAAARLTRFHRALRNTMDCSPDLVELANQIAAKLGVNSPFQLRMTEARLSPLVWPIGRPTILLSRPLFAELSAEEIETLLAHELAHLKRRDHWLRWFELFVTTFYWWHPVLWWARQMIHNAEEQACDAWVVSTFPAAAKRYASALFKVMQMVSDERATAPLVASQLGSTGNLKERIEDIMNAKWECRLTLPARIVFMLAALSILPLSIRAVSGAGEQSAEQKAQSTAAYKDQNDKNASANEKTNPYRVSPGDVLHVSVRPDRPDGDAPIADDFRVEPSGALALGPGFGRVKVAGLTLEDAERVVTEHLAAYLLNPQVQVTLGGWRSKHSAQAGRPEVASENAQTIPSSPDELAALREHVRFLDERFKSIDSLYKTGSRGGSADARARTGFELATAQAELAAAEGHRDQAIAYGEQAEKFAAEAMNAVNASYDAGRLALDTLLQTAKDVSDSKRRLVRLREPQATVTVEAKRDIASRVASSDSNTSVTVSKTLMQRTLQKYERIKRLAELKVVPAEEVEAAKTDYEVSIAQVEHAQRTLKYAQLLVELADTEYQEALAKNKSAPNSVSEFELKKLKLKVELAKVKASEVE